MTRTIRHLITTTAIVVAAATTVAAPAGAVELAPAPEVPKPNLWAVPEVICIGTGTPGLKWTMGNDTNGTHIFSLRVSGSHVVDIALSPGEVRTRQFQSPIWEDSAVHFEVIWKSQGTVIAQITPWFDCIEPDLSHSFGKVGAQGEPCAGLVEVELSNSGTQAAEVRLQAGEGLGQTTQFTLGAGTSLTKQIHVGTGTMVVASYYRPFFDGWEFFVETTAVDCADPLPHLPPPAEDGDGGNGGGQVAGGEVHGLQLDEPHDTPGGTVQPADHPEPGLVEELTDPVVKDRIAAAVSDGAPLWGLWLVLVVGAVGVAPTVLHRA